jgi:hypothetical protein
LALDASRAVHRAVYDPRDMSRRRAAAWTPTRTGADAILHTTKEETRYTAEAIE